MAPRPRVAIPDDWNGAAARSAHVERLRAVADVAIHNDRPGREELKARLREVDGLILWRERTRLDAELLEAAERLRVIGQTGYSWSHIDLEVAGRRGVAITATRLTGQGAVPEFTLGLILNLAYRISYSDRQMRGELWPPINTSTVAGKTLGIIGYGRIGRAVAGMAAALGMRVIAWSRSIAPGQEVAPGVQSVALDELLAGSHFVSVHLRLAGGTRGLLTREKLGLMRKDAYFINTARGPIADEGALLELLRAGRIAGAALDVYGQEPLPMDHPLRSLDNVVLTPHIGWTNHEWQEEMLQDAVDNVVAFFEGRPTNVVPDR